VKHLILLLLLASPAFAQEKVDLEVVHRIRQEAFKKSKVMDHLFYLVEVNGPRITGSPGFQGAADWVVERLNEYGLENARQEKWGPFGVGWSRSYYSAHLTAPQYEMLIGVPIGWTPSTKGVVRGTPLLAPLTRHGDYERDEAAIDAFISKHRGKLSGCIVLLADTRRVDMHERAEMRRYSNEELTQRASAPDGVIPIGIDYNDPNLEIPEDPEKRREFLSQAPAWFNELRRKERLRIQGKLNKFLTDEGVALAILPAVNGDGGTVFPPRMGDRDPDFPTPPPAIAVTPEQYNRIVRLVERGIEPQLEVETRTTLHRDTLDSINVIAEIPGSDKAEEIVMLGGHLDSTEAALGATDNGAGCAVMMEAVRILKELKLPLRRTVRIALWGGEEQGLLGSKAYVTEHFGNRETMRLTAEHENLSGYFNVDNGSGKIRGVYLQENDMVRPIFESWLRPFQDLDARTLSIRNTGGTDHLSFDAVGLPGFQFIQDPLEYETRTHHSNMDAYDRAQPADLMQAAAIVASFIYHAANRDEKLPRKQLPEPEPLTKP
jgi:hypothetical protein